MPNTSIYQPDRNSLASEIFRSINILHDIDFPERINHYHPTTKSLKIIRSLIINSEPANNIVVAPYGSGKSLLATFIGQLLENNRKSNIALKETIQRIKGIDQDLHDQLCKQSSEQKEHETRKVGLAIPLVAYQANLGESLCCGLADALERLKIKSNLINDFRQFQGTLTFALENISASKTKLVKEALKSGVRIEKILILWDEFGVHLEQLISRGDANRLNEVQLLAEFTTRQKAIRFSYAVFLHQSLINYSSGLSQSTKNEWKKIEGRFETIQYVDDSLEIIRLIGKIVQSLRNKSLKITEDTEKLALQSIKAMGLFRQLSIEDQRRLVYSAYPLEPATLYALPRLSARVAQNERTLFAFLRAVNLEEPVSPSDVFDYFEETMHADSSSNGLFHQWNEIRNALEISSSKLEVEIIKITGILGIGISGRRARVSKSFLEHAATGYRNKYSNVKHVVEKLLNEKVLLHRKNSDHVTIWHGVDLDLQGKLAEQKLKYEYSFDLLQFLQDSLPARPWFPLEYNARKKMKRYFLSRYVVYSEINEAIEKALKDLANNIDGIILHIISNAPEKVDVNILKSIFSGAGITRNLYSQRILFSFPNRHIPIYDRALEVYTLQIMQGDYALLNEDPLVLPELKIMTDDAVNDLNKTLQLLTYPHEDGPSWYINRKMNTISSSTALRKHLSDICFKCFGKTPVLNNELVVRQRPRAPIVNARKKLVSGILEDIGHETLGLDGFRPDTSMLRTLLIQTGLYTKNTDGKWNFVEPELVEDKDLRTVWQMFKKLFQEASDNPKDLKNFFQTIKDPPISLRQGVYPIFFSAALMTFGKNITLCRGNSYVEDITPNVIESLCQTPDKFSLKIHEISNHELKYMESIASIFHEKDNKQQGKQDIIRRLYDVIRNWLNTLPPATFKTKKLSKESGKLIKKLQWLEKPMKVFFEVIPELFPSSDNEICNEDRLKECVYELESIIEIYYEQAEKIIRQTLKLKKVSHLPEDIKQWTCLIPQSLIQDISDIQAVALFNRLTMSYDSSHLFIDSVASLIVDKTVNRWDDSSIIKFDRNFHSAIARIEDQVIRSPNFESQELIVLVTKRFEYLFESLTDIMGRKQAREKLEKILKEMN